MFNICSATTRCGRHQGNLPARSEMGPRQLVSRMAFRPLPRTDLDALGICRERLSRCSLIDPSSATASTPGSANICMHYSLGRARLIFGLPPVSLRLAYLPSISNFARTCWQLPRRAFSSMSDTPDDLFNYSSGRWL